MLSPAARQGGRRPCVRKTAEDGTACAWAEIWLAARRGVGCEAGGGATPHLGGGGGHNLQVARDRLGETGVGFQQRLPLDLARNLAVRPSALRLLQPLPASDSRKRWRLWARHGVRSGARADDSGAAGGGKRLSGSAPLLERREQPRRRWSDRGGPGGELWHTLPWRRLRPLLRACSSSRRSRPQTRGSSRCTAWRSPSRPRLRPSNR